MLQPPCDDPLRRFVEHPEQHLFHVTMEIPDVSDEVIVAMPAWNALYQVRDFAMHVQRVEALRGRKARSDRKVDKQTWKITANGTVTVRYDTFWDDGGPFGTELNTDQAFINPAMILMYVPERRTEEVRVESGPFAEWLDFWPVRGPFNGLSTGGVARDLHAWLRGSYDELTDYADSSWARLRISTCRIRSRRCMLWCWAMSGGRKILQEELRRVVAYEVKLMEGAPYPGYTFLLRFGKAATGELGGMEHADSTAISVRSDEDFANIGAHEFFHLWNVKRIHPAAFDLLDFTKEQYSRAFWFAEGVTNTYASYTMVRTGLWNKHQFYDDFCAAGRRSGVTAGESMAECGAVEPGCVV